MTLNLFVLTIDDPLQERPQRQTVFFEYSKDVQQLLYMWLFTRGIMERTGAKVKNRVQGHGGCVSIVVSDEYE